jgi:DNA primase
MSEMAGSILGALDRDFAGIRCRLIELAAALDRASRASNYDPNDPRLARIRSSLEILLTDAPDRAERVQMAFSLEHNAGEHRS